MTIKYSTLSHTNPEEITLNKINIGSKGLVKYAHPKYGKFHVLILRLPVCKLDKYPVENMQAFKNADGKVPVSLKIPVDAQFTTNPVYMFIQAILEKYGNKQKPEKKYPVYDPNKESNYIKIKYMDSYDSYSVTEIFNESDIKIRTKTHNLTSIADLYGLFSSGMQVVPYVMLYFHKTPAGDFVTLRPVKFYIGKSLTMEQIDYVNKKSRYVPTPKSDFYDANQIARPVSISDFADFIKDSNSTNLDENTHSQLDMTVSNLDIIC